MLVLVPLFLISRCVFSVVVLILPMLCSVSFFPVLCLFFHFVVVVAAVAVSFRCLLISFGVFTYLMQSFLVNSDHFRPVSSLLASCFFSSSPSQ